MDALLAGSLLVDPVLVNAAAASVGAVLLIGAAEKFREPEAFRDAVENYRLLPAGATAAVALGLPVFEGLAGTLLLPDATRPFGSALACWLLLIVTAAIAINLKRGRVRIDCGCGGSLHTPLSLGLVLRNGLLMLVALAASAPVTARPVVWLDYAAAGFATLFLLGLYYLANAMLSHQSHLLDLRNAP